MRWFPIFAACSVFTIPALCQLSVQLTASSAATPLVGVPISFTATAADTNPGPIDYRFSVSLNGGNYQTIVDYNSYNTITWTPSLQEGTYSLQVTARNKTAGDSGTSQVQLNVQSQVIGNQGTITATANPLVALYSAPPCPVGHSISVVFGTGGSFNETDQKAMQRYREYEFLYRGNASEHNLPDVLGSERQLSSEFSPADHICESDQASRRRGCAVFGWTYCELHNRLNPNLARFPDPYPLRGA